MFLEFPLEHAMAITVFERPVSEGLFAGALDISKVPPFRDRLKFRLSVVFGDWSEGDHWDWNAIRAWAADLKPIMAAKASEQRA